MNRTDLTLGHTGYARLEIIASAIAAVFLRVRQAWIAARARNDLHALSDHTLKDIGLSRAQIDSLFR